MLVVPEYIFAPTFFHTVEGCVLANCGRDIERAAMAAFATMPEQVKKTMATSAPKQGEFIARARIWQAYLAETTTPEQLHTAMGAIYKWYGCMKCREVNS